MLWRQLQSQVQWVRTCFLGTHGKFTIRNTCVLHVCAIVFTQSKLYVYCIFTPCLSENAYGPAER